MSQADVPVAPAKDPQAIINDAINAVSHIATLPEITVKIIQLVENPKSTAQDLHKLISNDPALVARILKVVNSAFYGLPGQIGSINRAIVLLGLNAVKNIVIAASLAKLFRGGRVSAQFSAKDLWSHSVGVGVMAKLITAKLNGQLPDEAFLGGLIHDIGILVELQSMRDSLVEVAEKATREERRYVDIETQVIGVDHQALGAGLTAKWKFPRSFQYVTGHHHNPMALAMECRWLSCVVHVADHVCTRENIGYSLTCKGEALDPAVLEELKLPMETVNELAKQLPEALKETEALLS
ncbi:MAG TPA: HDOD domain-containing protein [Phycisphaerae bacterium]|jgi:HD-like signal output (HDOD) protein|nr:HDOD domain-containing protein [Phycisphaerae bacterium]